jgi:hypothetical protein
MHEGKSDDLMEAAIRAVDAALEDLLLAKASDNKALLRQVAISMVHGALLAERQRDRWEAVSSAPHACHVVASYFDHSGGEWVYAIVMSPPLSSVWTHWQPLPAPPSSTEER